MTQPWEMAEWEALVDDNTRFLYAEMPSNPQQACCDLEKVARLAHAHGIPLIVDATIATPALMRPLQWGADIVVHSLTKTVGSGGFTIGGGIVARCTVTSRHLPDEVKADYATWLKLWPFRDSGPCMSPYSAFFLLNDLRTLRMKVEWLLPQHHEGGRVPGRPSRAWRRWTTSACPSHPAPRAGHAATCTWSTAASRCSAT